MLNRIVLLLFTGIFPLFLLGCGKRSEAPSAPPARTVSRATPPIPQGNDQTPATSPMAPADPSQSTDVQRQLAALTQAVRRYSVEKQRVATSLDEVARAGYIQIMPTPPTGKKFAISHSTVILEKQ